MLFGHQNDDTNQPAAPADDTTVVPSTDGVNPLAVDPDTGISLPVPAEELEHDAPDAAPDQSAPEVPTPPPVSQPAAPTSEPGDDDMLQPSGDDDLLHLKQEALSQLSPLVGHLDQTPEEKFRTTMMMIQSSDNQALIKDAYEAAQQISDDKVRAQALLDIVNEINYFTQQHDK